MINRIDLKNFGPLSNFHWRNLGPINLIVGGNGAGKTFLLKAIYCTMRTLEQYKRGNDQRTAAEILREKLYWTFQPDKIGDLVTKGADGALSSTVQFDRRDFTYSFGKNTTIRILSLETHVSPRTSNSIFLPTKEVLSLHQIILKSREQDKVFGFDDTYLDLARALRQGESGPAAFFQPQDNHLDFVGEPDLDYTEFAESLQSLEGMLGGRVESSDRWQFKTGNQKFPIGVTSEGIKKIAILDTLLGNGYLDTNSIVLIDEPESALHPVAISDLLDIVAVLAELGIQFFLASDSYFVLKKLYLIAQKKSLSIPVISGHDDQWIPENLKDGMPENSIIDESIRLYMEEVDLVLK